MDPPELFRESGASGGTLAPVGVAGVGGVAGVRGPDELWRELQKLR